MCWVEVKDAVSGLHLIVTFQATNKNSFLVTITVYQSTESQITPIRIECLYIGCI